VEEWIPWEHSRLHFCLILTVTWWLNVSRNVVGPS
jgi:hypothetical protein